MERSQAAQPHSSAHSAPARSGPVSGVSSALRGAAHAVSSFFRSLGSALRDGAAWIGREGWRALSLVPMRPQAQSGAEAEPVKHADADRWEAEMRELIKTDPMAALQQWDLVALDGEVVNRSMCSEGSDATMAVSDQVRASISAERGLVPQALPHNISREHFDATRRQRDAVLGLGRATSSGDRKAAESASTMRERETKLGPAGAHERETIARDLNELAPIRLSIADDREDDSSPEAVLITLSPEHHAIEDRKADLDGIRGMPNGRVLPYPESPRLIAGVVQWARSNAAEGVVQAFRDNNDRNGKDIAKVIQSDSPFRAEFDGLATRIRVKSGEKSGDRPTVEDTQGEIAHALLEVGRDWTTALERMLSPRAKLLLRDIADAVAAEIRQTSRADEAQQFATRVVTNLAFLKAASAGITEQMTLAKPEERARLVALQKCLVGLAGAAAHPDKPDTRFTGAQLRSAAAILGRLSDVTTAAARGDQSPLAATRAGSGSAVL
ncbi:hypothetical protein WG922_19005 [Ramlibacter sp. AN1015]|uniref:hypothetical protein n=1 Tax=Ramlibacter sp. AN1015 TaxID=3133428 RepID=UPI0030C3D3C3